MENGWLPAPTCEPAASLFDLRPAEKSTSHRTRRHRTLSLDIFSRTVGKSGELSASGRVGIVGVHVNVGPELAGEISDRQTAAALEGSEEIVSIEAEAGVLACVVTRPFSARTPNGFIAWTLPLGKDRVRLDRWSKSPLRSRKSRCLPSRSHSLEPWLLLRLANHPHRDVQF